MHEISIGGVLVSPLTPCLFAAIPGFWLVDHLLRRFGFYRFVWHKDLVRIALFVIIFSLIFNFAI
jgi:protein AaeX